MIRKGWLDNGPGPDHRRGADQYVAVPWQRALDILAGELSRVRDKYGASSIFGGSYGWSSAGRFHHAQSQVHRFLNLTLGGYVRSVNSYSSGASSVLLPRVMGDYEDIVKRNVTWDQIATQSEVVLAFGGMALKNSRVAGGGISKHVERGAMRRASERGCRFVLISPLRDDLPKETSSEWISLVPGTDTALMMAIVHTLVSEGLQDQDFLNRYTVGWSEFKGYLFGEVDGQQKDADWAEPITSVPARTIVALARSLHQRRTVIVVSHSLQRALYGEQPVWMGAVLAAVLGQIGLPGGGYAYGLGAIAYYGRQVNSVPMPTLPQGRNGVSEFIPVARIADMLLSPGAEYHYNGKLLNYPDIRLAYWAGGNPFHHHQDLARLRTAFAKLDTFVVHDFAWTATARHADFVLPCTMTLERDDIGANSNDPLLIPMKAVVPPYGQSRSDYEIFADLSRRFGTWEAFTEGRSAREWLEHLYQRTRHALEGFNLPAPSFDEFWSGNGIELPQHPDDGGKMRRFRNEPESSPLPTPSGKIEISSSTIASFGYKDCLGHPAWFGPAVTPDEGAPLILIANQPATRLHSQLDFGGYSSREKVRDREVVRMNPVDAEDRSVCEGDIVRISNARGACLAAVKITESVRAGVVQLSTGAWYSPLDPSAEKPLCVHGNPNVLTCDVGTSSLAQGCTGQLTTVQVARFEGVAPRVEAFDPPRSD